MGASFVVWSKILIKVISLFLHIAEVSLGEVLAIVLEPHVKNAVIIGT